MCFDSARNRTVLFGGFTETPEIITLGDTWEWDGAFWTQMEDTGPAPRHDFSLVYDTARKVSVLFGGNDANSSFGDTWQWDGTAWTKLSESGPGPRTSTAMAFDSNRNRVVLFGGETPASFHTGDTWEFDGNDWTQVQDAGPPVRSAHTMAFDSVANRVVMFGGVDFKNVGLADTWAWDGNEWVQIAEFGPTPRFNAAMTSASGSNLLLFGGADAQLEGVKPNLFGDTWSFDGKRWTQRQDIGPGPAQTPAMSFDSARNTIVLFGGLIPDPAGGSNIVSGLTWEVPVTPAAPPPVVVPAVLKLVSITSPPQVFRSTTLTFTLNGPAAAGGTIIHLNVRLFDVNGTEFTQFTIPAGQTTFDLNATFERYKYTSRTTEC